MSYELGIDLGTTYTAAAVCRSGDADVVTLGTQSVAVPSVVYLGPDGTVLFGEAAERRAVTDPGRVVREFKRRIGDDTPLVIDGRSYPVHEVAAQMVRWVADRVAEQEGGPARRIAVTHPASWGEHKKELLRAALVGVGLQVTFLAEPQAAAVCYAAAERVEPGSTIAIYDLGGGTFDAALVRKTSSGDFELLGHPEGIDNLGGVDFDEAVFRHVTAGLGEAVEALDPGDPDVLTAVARLRRECVEAKEALSADTEATIPVLLPDLQTQARLTRAEFEGMIRPALERTVEALLRAVSSAGLTPADLNAVLLVGGSSRIPLVTRMVSTELDRPVAVDADPRTAIALGAALVLSPRPRSAPARTHTIIAPGGAAGVIGAAAAGATTPPETPTAPGTGGWPTQPTAPPHTPPPWRPEPETRRMPPAASAGYPRSSGNIPRVPSSRDRRREGPPSGRIPPTLPPAGRQSTRGGGKPPSGKGQRSSAGMVAIGGTLVIVALLGALLVWPGLASGFAGDQPPNSTVPPTTIGGGGNNNPGGGGGTSDPGGGNNNPGGGGNDNGGGGDNNPGGGDNNGGNGGTVTTQPPQTTGTTATTGTTTTTSTTTTTTTPTTTSTTLPPDTTGTSATTSSTAPGGTSAEAEAPGEITPPDGGSGTDGDATTEIGSPDLPADQGTPADGGDSDV